MILGIDLSRSVGQEGRETALGVLESAKRLVGPDTRTGLLTFGRTPQWEWLPHPGMATPELSSRLDRDETDIQAALQAAVAQVGEGREGKILLISDGNENRGEVARVIPLLHERRRAVHRNGFVVTERERDCLGIALGARRIDRYRKVAGIGSRSDFDGGGRNRLRLAAHAHPLLRSLTVDDCSQS